MSWRPLCVCGVLGVMSALVGRGDSPPPRNLFPNEGPGAVADPVADAARERAASQVIEGRDVVLGSVVEMLRHAGETPGGNYFGQATERLNQVFGVEPAATFRLGSEAREFIKSELPEPIISQLEAREYTFRDARHIEDCMLYQAVARRVAGDGDDLTRARRVFDWVGRYIQLVPAGTLAPPNLAQAQARPYDVLMRGMATEPGGYWAERAWLYMALCRQLGLDVGLLSFAVPEAAAPAASTAPAPGQPAAETRQPTAFWACAVLADGKPYLFDARAGLPIPGPEGRPVATLDEVIADPKLLERLDLPGEADYAVHAADLAGRKFTVLIDSTLGYLTPRMRALETELSGKNRLIIHRDPAAQRDAFAGAALGEKFERAKLWGLPFEVELRLFTDPDFVTATQFPIQRFDARYPLLHARMAQLRGELDDAIRMFVAMRFSDNPLEVDKKTRIPAAVQHDLDMYATYFLGLCQMEKNNPTQAEFLFKQALGFLPEPPRSGPVALYVMFRWGVLTNLGHLHAARGETARAIRYFCADTRTSQNRGNRVLARELVWADPMDPGPLTPDPGLPAATPPPLLSRPPEEK